MKTQSVKTLQTQPTELLEQEYITNEDKLQLMVPVGYHLITVIETLPLIDQTNDKAKFEGRDN